MEVIVVGAGKVGLAIAEKLCAERHSVVIIDTQQIRLQKIADSLDALTVEGNGSWAETLETAGINKADLFIAVTDHDEVNLVACRMAQHYGVPRRIARIGELSIFPRDGRLKPEDMGINLIINPEQVCAQEISRLLRTQAVNESHEFVEGRVVLLGLSAGYPNPLIDRPLSHFQGKGVMEQIRVMAIARDGKTIIPWGDTRVEAGDDLYFMCPAERQQGLFDFLGVDNSPPEKVLIVGGGDIGHLTARLLEQQDIEVRLLEFEVERAETLAARLSKTTVFHGEQGNLRDLQKAGLSGVDSFVATSKNDELNILSCLMAKQSGTRKTLAVIRKPEYLPLISSLKGVDAAVSPRMITASAILRFMRRGKILSAVTIREIEAEVIELEVQAKSTVTNKKIKQIRFPKDAIMGCIVRGDRVLTAHGEETLLAEDRVVVLARPSAIRTVEDIFDKKSRGLFL